MATSMKRTGTSRTSESESAKQSKDSDSVNDFIEWCDNGNMFINTKVRVCRESSCADYGLVATAAIEPGEVLFETPRSLILTPQTSKIASLLEQGAESLGGSSSWVPLLLALLHEYTAPQSHWRPYFNIVEAFNTPNLPMFWNRVDMLKELKGTDIVASVERDLERLTEEFRTVVLPFISKHSEVFPPECQDVELYKRLVGLVMSYSFTEPRDQPDSDEEEPEADPEPQQPMMVPMADILNHVAKNNAHLDFNRDALKMIAVKPIQSGEEIFNTYGELSNTQLLHMYGFAEPYPNNLFDVIFIPMKTLFTAVLDNSPAEMDFLNLKWNFLEEERIVSEDGDFVLGCDGFLTEEELYQTLKVLSLDEGSFASYREERSDEDDDWCESLTNEDIKDLPEPWKRMLQWTCMARLAEYDTTLEEERRLRTAPWGGLTRRQQHASHVRHGHLQLLHGLLDRCRLAS